jgi:GDP-D-mannose dehydratase
MFFFLFVKAMWLMLQVNEPQDFVIATSESHTVREFLEIAFNKINKEIVLVSNCDLYMHSFIYLFCYFVAGKVKE